MTQTAYHLVCLRGKESIGAFGRDRPDIADDGYFKTVFHQENSD